MNIQPLMFSFGPASSDATAMKIETSPRECLMYAVKFPYQKTKRIVDRFTCEAFANYHGINITTIK